MKQLLLLLVFLPLNALAAHRILSPEIKSLEVITNDDFMMMPVIRKGSNDVIRISFDELSHNYHRFVCHLEPCNPDWTPVEGLFESDWLTGFNDQPIESYDNSLNTNVLYTHYSFQFPNAQTNIRLSGNYRLSILDEDNGMEEVAVIELYVVEPLMTIGLGVTTNTDIDFQLSHQQVAMTLNYNSVRVTNPEEQLQTVVMQNGRSDNSRVNVQPNSVTPRYLKWEHNRDLIFDAGNEYHKFEVLDPSHISMGLAAVNWDEEEHRYHAYPTPCLPQHSYIYDEDANGAFLLRNSDNYDAERTSEYVWVHYKFQDVPRYDDYRVFIDGRWATESADTYTMTYDESDRSYNAVILQKLGYYNYQLLMQDIDGRTRTLPQNGSFYQTENQYQAFAYYKAPGERTWRLLAYQEIYFQGE